MPAIQFVVDRRAAGQTLASALKLRFGISWAQAKRLVERGHVKVSGQVEKDVARRLKLGKRVELAAGSVEVKKVDLPGQQKAKKPAPSAPPAKVQPKKKPTDAPAKTASPQLPPDCIVYQDDFLVVVNKPVGLTTMRHTEEAEEFGARAKKFLPKTLADLLPAALGTPNRPVIAVHRLDRDTSGLVVFARTREVANDLMLQFRKHTTERKYLALTRGTPKSGRIESIFVRDRGDGRRGTSRDLVPEDGKRAVTLVAVAESWGEFALVECRLETGRTHQVRIHLGELGTPLCGESVYDRPCDGKPLPDTSGAKRPMLHAAKLGFVHPDSEERVVWECPPPADFAQLLTELRVKA